MNEPAIVRVAVHPEAGGYAAHSPDLFGLNLWALTMEALCERIREGIKLLYRVNRQMDVHVSLARPADFAPPALVPGRDATFVIERHAA